MNNAPNPLETIRKTAPLGLKMCPVFTEPVYRTIVGVFENSVDHVMSLALQLT